VAFVLVLATERFEVVEEVRGLLAVREDEHMHTAVLFDHGVGDEGLRRTDGAGDLHAGGFLAQAIGHAGHSGIGAVEGEEVGEGGDGHER